MSVTIREQSDQLKAAAAGQLPTEVARSVRPQHRATSSMRASPLTPSRWATGLTPSRWTTPRAGR